MPPQTARGRARRRVRGAACPPCPAALPASDAPEDSTAMMPSLARTTSAVCSLPGAHAHTRSVVCLCWRRGVMLTCTRAGVCWASSTRGMRAARTSQRRSQAGLARRRVRGGVHARSSCRARLLLHDNAANMTHRPPDGQLRAARMVTCVHTQEQLCAASPPRRSRSGRPRFARRQVRIHTCERSRLCVVSTAPCPHRRGSHELLLRRPTTLPRRETCLLNPTG